MPKVLLQFLYNYFLSCADATNIFCVSVPKHQRHFLTYLLHTILHLTGQVFQDLEYIT